MAIELIVDYARRVRELRERGRAILNRPSRRHFNASLRRCSRLFRENGLIVVPEFRTPGVGRPDIALKRAGQPARAFIELKAPTKPSDPRVAAIVTTSDNSNVSSPADLGDIEFCPASAFFGVTNRSARSKSSLKPRSIRMRQTQGGTYDPAWRSCRPDHSADAACSRQPAAREGRGATGEQSGSCGAARAADIVTDRLAELTEANEAGAPLQTVRDEFREVLYAHPQAAGYNAARFEPFLPPPSPRLWPSACCLSVKRRIGLLTATRGKICRRNTHSCARRFAC